MAYNKAIMTSREGKIMKKKVRANGPGCECHGPAHAEIASRPCLIRVLAVSKRLLEMSEPVAMRGVFAALLTP